MKRKGVVRKRGFLLSLPAAAAILSPLLVGCGHPQDSTYTAAPPPGPNAHPMPTVHRARPLPKLPPLANKAGQPPRGGNSGNSGDI